MTLKTSNLFLKKKKKKKKKLFLGTDDQNKKKIFKNNVKFYPVSAKDLLECFLNGYSLNNQDIFYHNTYYE